NTTSAVAKLIISVSDSDNDGMPDDWENQYGLNPQDPLDADVDSDKDGLSNLQEFMAGTNPKDSNSVLRLKVMRILDGTIKLGFEAQTNKTYSVLYQTNLNSADWNVFTNIDSAQTVRDIQIIIVPGSDKTKFYRVVTPRQ
ncbi:MAG TPA: thrombospondin type 3 repeat-containing protein, partial [Verrucomicrobiota bacterium]|nr:thrombospondin type 3 repeat-containing protein [Verrucomicrobiota bacterium]